jgi:hypothetical protein
LFLLIVIRYFTTRLVYKNGDTVRITAVVYSDPVDYPGTQGLKIAGFTTYLLVFLEVSYGDLVVIEGSIDNGKLKNSKLITVIENRGLASGVRNKIIGFYQSILPQPMSLLRGMRF